MRARLPLRILPFALVLTAACSVGGDADGDAEPETTSSAPPASVEVDPMGPARGELTAEDVERGRYDASWRRFAEMDREERLAARATRDDTAGAVPSGVDSAAGGAEASDTAAAAGARTGAAVESFDAIGSAALEVDPTVLPLGGEAEGPSVLAVQVLLDRARFSPGVADGRWGKNTAKAVYWLQSERGMEPTGTVDRATLDLLRREAGASGPLSREIQLTKALVSGPFVNLPEDIYERAEMECLCYESLGEKLAERFHTTREVLGELNPGVDLDALVAGDALVVPDHGGPVDSLGAGDPTRGGAPVARIVVSDGGHYLHALAADGSVLYHFPSTLGSEYAPSPSGSYAINAIAHDPTWHYQPDLLTGEDDSRPDAVIPAGPNNPVGVVWLDLTRPHYGIHGTAAPSTIGYTTSHGCVRLTNWDAAFLASRAGVEAGTPVEFRDGDGRPGG